MITAVGLDLDIQMNCYTVKVQHSSSFWQQQRKDKFIIMEGVDTITPRKGFNLCCLSVISASLALF